LWQRFVQYTNRIETIRLDAIDHWGVTEGKPCIDAHTSTLVKLGQLLARPPATFQRLRAIELIGNNVSAIEKVFSYALLLASPTLTRITVAMEDNIYLSNANGSPVVELAQLFLASVVDGNCTVSYLDISVPRIPSYSALFETISQLKSISELHLGTLYFPNQDSASWISHIGSLPALKSLSLHVEPLAPGFKIQSPFDNCELRQRVG
jgi:hypothetical protein